MNLKTKISLKKKLLCLAIALICVVSSLIIPHASAKTIDELNDEYAKIEQEIQEDKEKLDEVEDDIKTNEQKLNKLNNQIDKINSQIDLLDESIDILNGDINDIKNNINITENDIEEINIRRQEILLQVAETQALMEDTKELLLERIRMDYMTGGDATELEFLLSSGDLETFFVRKEILRRNSEEDAKLINELTEKIKELEALNTELEAKKVELEEKEESLNSQMTSLEGKQKELEESKGVQEDKKSEVTDKQNEVKYLLEDLDKDSDAYKAAIKRKEADLAALEAQIEEAIKANGSEQGEEPEEEYNNDGKMLWPVPGSTRLTATYPSYSDGSPHWGIDIVRTDVTTKGSPFRAAQGGKVILAKNDGNWNYGFGNYCIIDHGNGVHTLYAHAQSLTVSEGDIVQKGETIGYIGSTGNSTGPHLHFEVRLKDSNGNVSRVNPLNYVSKP